MSAVQQSVGRGMEALTLSVRRWPLWRQPPRVVAYVTAVVVTAVSASGVGVATTPVRLPELGTFAALMACAAVCVEAKRRLGEPAGVVRDLLSAWWLPVALLLPPVYALFAPAPLSALTQLRVRTLPLHRRVFTASAIGLAGMAASMLFHSFVPVPLSSSRGLLGHSPYAIGIAVGCGALYTLVNGVLVLVAAHVSVPESGWRGLLWDRESVILDIVEISAGILVTIACALTPALLFVALPPVLLLQRSLLHAQLQAAARTDAKTGLLNAAAWQREADIEIVRALRTQESLSLLLADIDHFKLVNDRHGHLVGDQVLIGVAEALRSQLREYDLLGRFGGEEFVVLLPHAETVEALKVAERLRKCVGRVAVSADDELVHVTISIGLAAFRTHGEDLIELLAAADLALYRAKESGRDRVCLPAGGSADSRSRDDDRRRRDVGSDDDAARSGESVGSDGDGMGGDV